MVSIVNQNKQGSLTIADRRFGIPNGEEAEVTCLDIEKLIESADDRFCYMVLDAIVETNGRFKRVLEGMENHSCFDPVEIVCDSQSGKCTITDGQRRIASAYLLGAKRLLTLIFWQDDAIIRRKEETPCVKESLVKLYSLLNAPSSIVNRSRYFINRSFVSLMMRYMPFVILRFS